MSAVYDSDITDIYEVSVLLALANHADDAGVCYPSMKRIARLARMGERGVQGVVKRLAERGDLSIELNAGPRGTNVYRIHVTPAPHADPAPGAPRTPRQGPPHPTTSTPAPHAPETSLTVIETSVTPIVPKLGFDDFWEVVPRKVAKGKAEQAWRKAIKIATPEVLISAMRVYANQRVGEDETFTAHPATWLNGKRWLDAPPNSAPAKVDDFHAQFEAALGGSTDGLPRTNEIDRRRTEQLSSPVQAPRSLG